MILVKNKKITGFTLVELLIVIALSSVVIFGAFQGYFMVKKIIVNYYQMIRLQNNIKLMTHELYHIKDKAGNFGCANSDQPLYLHVSKKKSPLLLPLLFINKDQLQGWVFLKKTDPKLKTLLPHAVYSRLKSDSDIIYTLETDKQKIKKNQNPSRVYADCLDVFILSQDDPLDYFIQNKQFNYIGNLSINLYFISSNKRKNNQDQPIYSLYRYNDHMGMQEILEGVESITHQSEQANKIKINVLLTSVEGNPALKQWLTVVI